MPGNLAEIPLDFIATWPAPDYDHPRDQRTWLVPVSIFIQVVVTVLVALRVFMRSTRKAGHFDWDDLFIITAFLFAVWFTALAILGVLYFGLDRHNYDIPWHNFAKLALVGWLAELAFLFSTTCTKVSVLLFYRRLANGAEVQRWKWCIWAAITFTVASNLAFVLTLLFMCRPLSAYWRAFDFPNIPEYYCAPVTSLNTVAGVFSVLSDLIAVILPVAMLRNFDISKRQRLALNCLFSLGLLICIIAALRTYYHGKLGYEYDLSWYAYDAFFWSLLEMQLALICAVAPVLRSFYRMYISKTVSQYASRDRKRVSMRVSPPDEIATFEKWARSSDSGSEDHEMGVVVGNARTRAKMPFAGRASEIIEVKS